MAFILAKPIVQSSWIIMHVRLILWRQFFIQKGSCTPSWYTPASSVQGSQNTSKK